MLIRHLEEDTQSPWRVFGSDTIAVLESWIAQGSQASQFTIATSQVIAFGPQDHGHDGEDAELSLLLKSDLHVQEQGSDFRQYTNTAESSKVTAIVRYTRYGCKDSSEELCSCVVQSQER